MSKVSRKKTVGHIISGGMINRLACIGIDMYLASLFGASPYIAVFLLSFRIFQLIKRTLTENGLQMMVIVPHLQALKRKNKRIAYDFLVNFSTPSLIFQIFAIILLEIAIYLTVYRHGVFGYQNQALGSCLAIILISIPIIFINTIFSAVLQSDNHFGATSYSPLVFNLVWLIGIAVVNKFYGPVTHVSLSWLLVFSIVAQTIWIAIPGKAITDEWKSRSSKTKVQDDHKIGLGREIIIGMMTLGVVQINSFIDSAFCAFASLSGPAYMWYASRIVIPLSVTIGSALAGSLVPSISKKYIDSRNKEADRIIEKTFMKSFFITVPLAGFMFASVYTILSILLLRGSFQFSDLIETSRCAIFLAASIPFSIGTRSLYIKYFAEKRVHITSMMSFIGVIANLILNYLFVFILKKDVAYVALATTISSAIQMLCTYYQFYIDATHTSSHEKHSDKLLSMFISVGVASILSIIFTDLFLNNSTISIISGISIKLKTVSMYKRILHLLFISSIFIGAFIGCLLICGSWDIFKNVLVSLVKPSKKPNIINEISRTEENNKYD